MHAFEGHFRSVASVNISPNSWPLASGSYDSTIKIWDPFPGNTGRVLRHNSAMINSIALSPDGLSWPLDLMLEPSSFGTLLLEA